MLKKCRRSIWTWYLINFPPITWTILLGSPSPSHNPPKCALHQEDNFSIHIHWNTPASNPPTQLRVGTRKHIQTKWFFLIRQPNKLKKKSTFLHIAPIPLLQFSLHLYKIFYPSKWYHFTQKIILLVPRGKIVNKSNTKLTTKQLAYQLFL